jgi:hypothetical protein
MTSWMPGERLTLTAPAPVAPSDVAGVYVSCAVVAVVPRFASVSSVEYRALPRPATSRTIGTSFEALSPAASALARGDKRDDRRSEVPAR